MQVQRTNNVPNFIIFRRRRTFARRSILSIFCLCIAALIIRDFRHTRPLNDGTYDRILSTGIIRIGMDASYPPFAHIENDQIVGLDAELAKEIGRRLGWQVQLVQVGYDGLYDALQINAVDALIAALPLDYTRSVIYTRPYLDGGQILVTLEGGKNDLETMLDMEGQSLAVEYGSVGDETARLWERRLHQLALTRMTSTDQALDLVKSRKVDAALVDVISARLFIKKFGGIRLATQTVVPETYHVATRTQCLDLAEAINAVLEDMDKDGTLDQIIARWL